jgi:hypothetical protein
MGLPWGAVVAPQRISRRCLGSIKKEATHYANVLNVDHITHKSRLRPNRPGAQKWGSSGAADRNLARHFTEGEMRSITGS